MNKAKQNLHAADLRATSIVGEIADGLGIAPPPLRVSKGGCYVGICGDDGYVYLYMSAGLIEKANDLELRALIAHELAHLALGHTARSPFRQHLRERQARFHFACKLPGNPCWRDEFAADTLASTVVAPEHAAAMIARVHRTTEMAEAGWSHPAPLARITRLVPAMIDEDAVAAALAAAAS